MVYAYKANYSLHLHLCQILRRNRDSWSSLQIRLMAWGSRPFSKAFSSLLKFTFCRFPGNVLTVPWWVHSTAMSVGSSAVYWGKQVSVSVHTVFTCTDPSWKMHLFPNFHSSTVIFSEDLTEGYNGSMRRSHEWQENKQKDKMRVEAWEKWLQSPILLERAIPGGQEELLTEAQLRKALRTAWAAGKSWITCPKGANKYMAKKATSWKALWERREGKALHCFQIKMVPDCSDA